MYSFLKRLVFSILPASWITKNKHVLRLPLKFLYKGKQHYCPVEDRHYKSFILYQHKEHKTALSPYSGMLPRQRFLWHVLTKKGLFEKKLQVLHFSPNAYFSKRIRKVSRWKYVTSDYEANSCDLRLDITNISLENNSQDLIICYHVLEHIEADERALNELFRITKPGGIIFLQVPWRDGETLQEEWVNTPALRLEHYWQEDHVRLYGKADFCARIQHTGFELELIDCKAFTSESERSYMGLNPDEIIFLAQKPKH